jgi:hypothetical protein
MWSHTHTRTCVCVRARTRLQVHPTGLVDPKDPLATSKMLVRHLNLYTSPIVYCVCNIANVAYTVVRLRVYFCRG